MSWKRSLTCIVSVILLLPFEQLVQACAGDWDPFDEYPSFFLNNVTNNRAFRPFYYTGSLAYYDLWDDEKEMDYRLPCTNIQEWKDYSDPSISLADIDSFVYTYPLAEVSSLYNHIEKDSELKMSKEAKQNEFTKWFIKNKDKEALGYLMYAKECEPHVQAVDGHYDQKSYEWIADKRDVAKMDKLRKNGMQLRAAAKDERIKLRYAYQVIRLALYSDQYPVAVQLYDELVGDKENPSIIYARCFGLKAGALYKWGRKDEAAYLYSKLFDMRDELKRQSFLSFDWSTNGNVEDALAYCKNQHERAVIYVMRGLHIYAANDQSLEWMYKAYSADPKVNGLDVVMTREINKVEANLYQSDANVDTKLKLNAYLIKLAEFAQKNANDPKTGSKAFWLLSASYIYYVQNDLAKCKTYMDLAAKEQMNDKETEQHEIIGTLYAITKDGKITARTEEELLPRLEKIEEQAVKNDRYKKVYRDVFNSVIAPMYLAQHDTIKALYAYEKGNSQAYGGYGAWYDFGDRSGGFLEAMDPERLHKVQQYVSNGKASKFDKWLVKGTGYSLDRLKELEGTKYIRMHRFDKAVAVLKDVPEQMLIENIPDIFVSHTDDYHEQYAMDSTHMYNKLSLAKAMEELHQTLLKTPADAKAAFKYATGLYSISYYGKADEACSYYRSSSDNNAYYQLQPQNNVPHELKEYYSVESAEKYFVQAFENSSDKEFQARCLFMAAKCWQKRSILPADTDDYFWNSGNDIYFVNSLQSPYLKRLAEEYKETVSFMEAHNTCAYLRAYVLRHP